MGTSDARRRPAPLGDQAELFREFNARLVRIVQRRTDAPHEMVRDACAFAWQQFLRHQPDRHRNWRSWLVTTAECETWRLHGAEARHLSLSLEPHEHEGIGTWEIADHRDPVTTRARLREALEAFARLPERRREIKALQITGFSYDEIAELALDAGVGEARRSRPVEGCDDQRPARRTALERGDRPAVSAPNAPTPSTAAPPRRPALVPTSRPWATTSASTRRISSRRCLCNDSEGGSPRAPHPTRCPVAPASRSPSWPPG